jgi:hypothetical protein
MLPFEVRYRLKCFSEQRFMDVNGFRAKPDALIGFTFCNAINCTLTAQ